LTTNWSVEEYLHAIVCPVSQDSHSELVNDTAWKRISSSETPQHPSHNVKGTVVCSFVQLLLSRCNLMCGVTSVPLHSRSRLDRLESESDAGKESTALLSLVGAISQVDLSLFIPFLSELKTLLSHGFSSPQSEVRVLCLQLISSLLQHTSTADLPSPTNSNHWIFTLTCTSPITSEWILHLTQEILTCSNDVEATVSTLSPFLFCLNTRAPFMLGSNPSSPLNGLNLSPLVTLENISLIKESSRMLCIS
jgi:hypothetical protein